MLSIITPVYNVEAYLDRCVRSILSQSYTDLELILVDDGSTDGTSAICDRWASEDCRVVVIHQQNQGVSAARNAALRVAKGQYLTFVDSDDFIAPDTYRLNMNFLLEHTDVDVVQFPYCHYVDDNHISNYHRPAVARYEGKEQVFRNWWSGTPLEYVIWNKIFKRDVWKGVSFTLGRTSEDTCLVAYFVERVKVVCISDQGLYYYQRSRKDSYTFTYDYRKHEDLFLAHATIYACFKEFPSMLDEKVLAFTRLFRRLIIAKQTDAQADIRAHIETVKRYFPSWREIICSHGTKKLWLLSAKTLGPETFLKLFLLYLKR